MKKRRPLWIATAFFTGFLIFTVLYLCKNAVLASVIKDFLPSSVSMAKVEVPIFSLSHVQVDLSARETRFDGTVRFDVFYDPWELLQEKRLKKIDVISKRIVVSSAAWRGIEAADAVGADDTKEIAQRMQDILQNLQLLDQDIPKTLSFYLSSLDEGRVSLEQIEFPDENIVMEGVSGALDRGKGHFFIKEIDIAENEQFSLTAELRTEEPKHPTFSAEVKRAAEDQLVASLSGGFIEQDKVTVEFKAFGAALSAFLKDYVSEGAEGIKLYQLLEIAPEEVQVTGYLASEKEIHASMEGQKLLVSPVRVETSFRAERKGETKLALEVEKGQVALELQPQKSTQETVQIALARLSAVANVTATGEAHLTVGGQGGLVQRKTQKLSFQQAALTFPLTKEDKQASYEILNISGKMGKNAAKISKLTGQITKGMAALTVQMTEAEGSIDDVKIKVPYGKGTFNRNSLYQSTLTLDNISVQSPQIQVSKGRLEISPSLTEKDIHTVSVQIPSGMFPKLGISFSENLSGKIKTGLKEVDLFGSLSLDGTVLNVTQKLSYHDAEKEALLEVELPANVYNLPTAMLSKMPGSILEASGKFGVKGWISLKSGQFTSGGSLLLENVAVRTSVIEARHISGVLTLDDLFELKTPKDQQIYIGLLQAGVPLTNGLLTFDISRKGYLNIHAFRWDMFGGTLSLTPREIPLDFSTLSLDILVKDLSLQKIADLAELKGAVIEGTLSGMLPIEVRQSQVKVAHGVLTTDKAGTLRYVPEEDAPLGQTTSGQVGLLLTALENFKYDQLRFELNGQTGDNLEALLAIKGKNPDLYGGYPVNLNLTVSGALDLIFQQNMSIQNMPQEIQNKIAKFYTK